MVASNTWADHVDVRLQLLRFWSFSFATSQALHGYFLNAGIGTRIPMQSPLLLFVANVLFTGMQRMENVIIVIIFIFYYACFCVILLKNILHVILVGLLGNLWCFAWP
jgi:hypothetical protein